MSSVWPLTKKGDPGLTYRRDTHWQTTNPWKVRSRKTGNTCYSTKLTLPRVLRGTVGARINVLWTGRNAAEQNKVVDSEKNLKATLLEGQQKKWRFHHWARKRWDWAWGLTEHANVWCASSSLRHTGVQKYLKLNLVETGGRHSWLAINRLFSE